MASSFDAACSQLIKDVSQGDVESIKATLTRLKEFDGVTVSMLGANKAGCRAVGKLRKHEDAAIASASTMLVAKWKSSSIGSPNAKRKAAPAGDDARTHTKKTRHSPSPKDAVKKEEERVVPIKKKEEERAVVKEEKSSSTDTPSTLSEEDMKCGHVARDKFRSILLKALCKHLTPEDVSGAAISPPSVIVSFEQTLYGEFGGTTAQYKSKIRAVHTSLGSRTNGELRANLLGGVVYGSALCYMSPEELTSSKLLEERKRAAKVMQLLVTEGQQAATTDAFRCFRCGKKECTYYEMQTR